MTLARLLGVSLDYLADDELDEPPAPALTEDERMILRVVRASGLDADELLQVVMHHQRGKLVAAAHSTERMPSQRGRAPNESLPPRREEPRPTNRPAVTYGPTVDLTELDEANERRQVREEREKARQAAKQKEAKNPGPKKGG